MYDLLKMGQADKQSITVNGAGTSNWTIYDLWIYDIRFAENGTDGQTVNHDERGSNQKLVDLRFIEVRFTIC